ncbi:MAG: hypothetical protein ACREAM_20590, partial [Blastocatellia bacterium]
MAAAVGYRRAADLDVHFLLRPRPHASVFFSSMNFSAPLRRLYRPIRHNAGLSPMSPSSVASVASVASA